MNGVIQVRPEHLRESAANLLKLKEQYDQITANVQRIKDNVSQDWRGSGQVKFLEEYNNSEKQVPIFGNNVVALAEMLKTHAKNIEDADSAMGR